MADAGTLIVYFNALSFSSLNHAFHYAGLMASYRFESSIAVVDISFFAIQKKSRNMPQISKDCLFIVQKSGKMASPHKKSPLSSCISALTYCEIMSLLHQWLV